LFLMILSNPNFLLSMFADFPRLILLSYFWKYKRMIKTSYAMTMILCCLLSGQGNLYKHKGKREKHVNFGHVTSSSHVGHFRSRHFRLRNFRWNVFITSSN
jgi:hypothetical protein